MPDWSLVTNCLYVLGGRSIIEDGSLLVESLNNAGLEPCYQLSVCPRRWEYY